MSNLKSFAQSASKMLMLVALLLLAGCGDGGGGGATNLSEALEINSGGGTVPDILIDGGIGELIRDEDLYGPIVNLFGNAIFTFQFTGDDDLFVLSVDWGKQSITQFSDGTYILSGLGNFSTIDAENNLTESGTRLMLCVSIDVSQSYFCSMGLPTGETIDINYNMGVDSTNSEVTFARSGTMEFCGVDITPGDCASELINSPDGVAVLSVYPSQVTSVLKTADNYNDGNLFVDHRLYYLDQGSASIGYTSNIDRSNDPVIKRIAELKNNINLISK